MAEIEQGRITYKEQSNGSSAKGPWTRTVYTLNNKKYSTFDSRMANFEKGDLVNINFEKSADGKFNNITNVNKVEQKVEEFETGEQILSKKSKEDIMWEKKDLRSARENALNNTSSLLNTIALVTPEYLVNAWKEKDPFEYMVEKSQEIVDFIYS